MTSEQSTTETNDAAATKTMPQWLKEDLFEDLLKKQVNGYKQIKSFKVLPGVGAGENYATIMLRVEFEIDLVDGGNKSLSFMLKIGHEIEMFKEMLKINNIFDVENNMYANIVPELEQLYRDVGLDVKFGASAYVIDAPTDYVLLENLAPKGFKNANRLECLDFEHVQCVLRKLAQWHAASATRVSVKGSYGDDLIKGFYKEETKPMMRMTTDSVAKSFLSCVPTYTGHEEYSSKLEAIQDKLVDIVYDMAKIDPNDFNALNHGDLWSNNVMFQYDAFGKIKETYFVDFQMPKYGSIAQDLYYFLISSTQLEIKLSKFDYFIKYYHDNLIEHLTLLKYPKTLPKLRDIHAMLYRKGAWAYGTAVGVMSGVLLDPMESANLGSFLSESADGMDFKKQLYINSRYRKHIEIVLPWLNNRGALDVRA